MSWRRRLRHQRPRCKPGPEKARKQEEQKKTAEKKAAEEKAAEKAEKDKMARDDRRERRRAEDDNSGNCSDISGLGGPRIKCPERKRFAQPPGGPAASPAQKPTTSTAATPKTPAPTINLPMPTLQQPMPPTVTAAGTNRLRCPPICDDEDPICRLEKRACEIDLPTMPERQPEKAKVNPAPPPNLPRQPRLTSDQQRALDDAESLLRAADNSWANDTVRNCEGWASLATLYAEAAKNFAAAGPGIPDAARTRHRAAYANAVKVRDHLKSMLADGKCGGKAVPTGVGQRLGGGGDKANCEAIHPIGATQFSLGSPKRSTICLSSSAS